MNNRQELNREINKMVSDCIEKFPDWRYGQILSNLGIVYRNKFGNPVDIFYDEPENVISVIRNNYNELMNNH